MQNINVAKQQHGEVRKAGRRSDEKYNKRCLVTEDEKAGCGKKYATANPERWRKRK